MWAKESELSPRALRLWVESRSLAKRSAELEELRRRESLRQRRADKKRGELTTATRSDASFKKIEEWPAELMRRSPEYQNPTIIHASVYGRVHSIYLAATICTAYMYTPEQRSRLNFFSSSIFIESCRTERYSSTTFLLPVNIDNGVRDFFLRRSVLCCTKYKQGRGLIFRVAAFVG